ncbi:MAG TPA: hypothetical protein DCK87_09230 [Desulfotomaculum sp.]|nr:hypothetical protein [Desulfotomaculum sp.]
MDIVLNTTKIVLASELDAEGIKRNHLAIPTIDKILSKKYQLRNNGKKNTKRHRVARPYRKNEQNNIESLNPKLKKRILGLGEILTSGSDITSK